MRLDWAASFAGRESKATSIFTMRALSAAEIGGTSSRSGVAGLLMNVKYRKYGWAGLPCG